MQTKLPFLIVALFINLLAVQAQLTSLPSGGNKKASVGEQIGMTAVNITYNRPGVKGREGHIWGELIREGYEDLGYGLSNKAPWRAGANECTTIEFSTDVMIEGKALAAGKYGLFLAMGAGMKDATLIFSKNSNGWGSYFYKPEDDVLRVVLKTIATTESVEWLQYRFINQTDDAATVALEWEKLRIPFEVKVDVIATQLASFRRELSSGKGFEWQAYVQAANFCADNNTHLEEALMWADYAIKGTYMGQKTFGTLSCKANVLSKMGKTDEATALMTEALPLGSSTDVHLYARALAIDKKGKIAFDAFKFNYEKHPDEFLTIVGMGRGYSAIGDYKKAAEFFKKALPMAPDEVNRKSITDMLAKVEAGKDANG